MNRNDIRIPILVALSLSACVHTHRTTDVSEPIGELMHTEAGSGTLSIHYAGKRYSGEYEWAPSHRIQGEHQRYPGRTARAELLAPTGEKLLCELQWGQGIKPAGSCAEASGKSFDIEFN